MSIYEKLVEKYGDDKVKRTVLTGDTSIDYIIKFSDVFQIALQWHADPKYCNNIFESYKKENNITNLFKIVIPTKDTTESEEQKDNIFIVPPFNKTDKFDTKFASIIDTIEKALVHVCRSGDNIEAREIAKYICKYDLIDPESENALGWLAIAMMLVQR